MELPLSQAESATPALSLLCRFSFELRERKARFNSPYYVMTWAFERKIGDTSTKRRCDGKREKKGSSQ